MIYIYFIVFQYYISLFPLKRGTCFPQIAFMLVVIQYQINSTKELKLKHMFYQFCSKHLYRCCKNYREVVTRFNCFLGSKMSKMHPRFQSKKVH